MDVSAHVRSKVLQIRHYIQGQNAVPLSSWQHQVLKGSVERLEDKSLLVRKNSIALILEHNPFSAKLSLAKLRNEERDGRRSAAGNSQQDVRAGPGAQENPTAVGVLHDVLESVLRQDPARPEPERGVPEKENEVNFLKDSIRFAEIVYAAGHGDVQVSNGCARILSVKITIDLQLQFSIRTNPADLQILRATRKASRVSISHMATGVADARTAGYELGKFSATATLRVIHLGHEIESFVLMQSYLPKESGLSSGCGLYALGLIRANHRLTLLERYCKGETTGITMGMVMLGSKQNHGRVA
ncbi:hypothetical protein pipiens_014099 [Culex pipiens pipiens]|uniref:Uncharacterized protein n=1 Tax=Culex pipiens pipiens TaxID=38569 RepID=A0ABD1CVT6_CULPP